MKNVITKEIELKGKEWEDLLDQSFKKVVKETKLDGFRKGNIPKEVFISKFGEASLYRDAMDLGLEKAYQEVFKDKSIIPVVEPKVDVKEIDNKHIVYSFEIITRPEVKLGDYTHLGVKKDEIKITAKEVDDEIKRLQDRYAEMVTKDGKIVAGDTAIIDFVGYVDGKPLEGGKGENYKLEIGSNTFIPGFEDGLVGLKKGDKKTLDLTFPAEYKEELKNKPVKFDVTIKEVKERVVPEINNDFFEDLGYDDVKSLDDLKKHVKKDLEHAKSHEVDDKYTEDCINKAVSNMKVEINPEIMAYEEESIIHQFEHQLAQSGMTIDQYLSYSKMSKEDLLKQTEPEAKKRIEIRYLLETIVDKENIKISDKELDKELESIAKEYNISKDDVLKEYGSMDNFRYDRQMRKAIDIVKEA